MNTTNQRNLNHSNNLSPHCDIHGAAFLKAFGYDSQKLDIIEN